MLKVLNKSFLNVLKLDCEGCEYALAREISLTNPHFFEKVGQFALEIHVSKFWITDKEHEHGLGILFYLLEQAGLKIFHAEIVACSYDHEVYGCPSTFEQIGFPCGIGKMCHNYLFARI